MQTRSMLKRETRTTLQRDKVENNATRERERVETMQPRTKLPERE